MLNIDSSCVVAFMARHSDRPVKTYSIGFEGGPAESFYNELPFARRSLDDIVAQAEKDAEFRKQLIADLDAALEHEGIEIPFPQRTLWLRNPEDESALTGEPGTADGEAPT